MELLWRYEKDWGRIQKEHSARSRSAERASGGHGMKNGARSTTSITNCTRNSVPFQGNSPGEEMMMKRNALFGIGSWLKVLRERF